MRVERLHPPLFGVRVVDASVRLPGAFCAKHLADAGAEVVRVEPAEGVALRRWSISERQDPLSDGPLFEFLAGGTRSVVGEFDTVERLAAEASVVIDDGPPGAASRLRETYPHLVLTTITPFGSHGPWADRPATEFTLQAWTGSMAARGTPDRPPLHAGGRIGEWAAGISAAVGTMAALREARRGGNGDHVDVSMFEVVAIMLTLYPYMFGALMGDRELTAVRMTETPGCEKTADGWIGFCCNSVEQAAAFWKLVGMPQLAQVPELVTAGRRSLDRAGVLPLFEDELLARTTADLLSEAVASRIPAVPVGHAADLLTNEQLATRSAYVESPHGFHQPRVPYTIGERPRRQPALAPSVGEHSDDPWSEPWDAPPAPGERRRPLDGIRVLDLTTWLAGPIATHTFAGLGAEVIKVESCHRFDNMRLTATKRYSHDHWWEFAPLFHGVNAGKRDVTLDLATEDGRRLARDLVQHCDVVIENGTPRVLDQLGLGWDVVHSLNDQTIVVRMPAFGLTGPWRDRPGFAQSMEQLSGMAMITGFPDGPPLNPRGPCDAIQAMQAAIATLAALDAREQTGVASMVEVTMVETILAIVAESQLEHEVHGVDLERMGNRGPYAAPQGLYPCRGEEKWLAVAVETDAQWDGLRAELDLPDDPALATMAGRQAAHDDLDARIGAWAAGQDIEVAVARLLSHGVPAASVESGFYLHRNEQLVDRGFFDEVEHPFAGRYGTPGLPFRLASVKRWFERAAPSLGQHNDEILSTLLGVSQEERERLHDTGVIGDRISRHFHS
jgi:crotonobetainyl-CoA:carnitine CoA-transferase CaiB-like acyl-CoA transferase